MAEYLVSFVVHGDSDVGSYDDRIASIYDAVNALRGGGAFWDDTTSFIAFVSSLDTRSTGRRLVQKLDEGKDILLIRRIGYKITYVWGAYSGADALTTLFPEIEQL